MMQDRMQTFLMTFRLKRSKVCPFTLTGVAEDDAKLAVDRNNQTTCFVNGNQLIIDLGEEKMISSFHFLPDQSEPNKGLISNSNWQ